MTKYSQGVKAAKAGQSETDCPYAIGYARKEWLRGFRAMMATSFAA